MALVDFVAGCFGGAAGVIVGHPLDTIKVKMQTSSNHCSAWKVIRDIRQRDSYGGFYRGMGSPLVSLAGINAVVFGVHGSALRALETTAEARLQRARAWSEDTQLQAMNQDGLQVGNHHENSRLMARVLYSDAWRQFIAGSVAGFAQVIITSPMELVKTRVQVDGGSSWSCLKRVLRTQGVHKGLYRGFAVTCWRDGPGFGLYFASYEVILNYLNRSKGEATAASAQATTGGGHEEVPMDGAPSSPPSMWPLLIAGGLAGAISWISVYPLDVIKTRIQADSTNAKYRNVWDALMKCYHQNGSSWSFLYRGMSPTLVRAVPVNAATFAVVTWTVYFWENLRRNGAPAAKKSPNALEEKL